MHKLHRERDDLEDQLHMLHRERDDLQEQLQVEHSSVEALEAEVRQLQVISKVKPVCIC